MNPSYPFYFNTDPDQTNLNEAQDRYRPGQLFWRRNQSENHQQIAENTFAATSTVLAPFQPQLQPMFTQAGFSGSLPLDSLRRIVEREMICMREFSCTERSCVYLSSRL